MADKKQIRTLVLVGVALMTALTMIGATTSADTSTAVVQATAAFEPDAPPPLVINYQGRLVNPITGEPVEDVPPHTPYNATFELWASETGDIPPALWSEKHQIVTTKGLFSVTLGDANPISLGLFDGSPRWLSVSIDPDGPLAPRIRVASAPYAIWSNLANLAGTATNADQLGGQPASSYTLVGHTHDASAITSGTLNYDLYSAYGDLVNDGRIGPASGMVAAGVHTHKGTDIVDGSIATADLADGSVTSAKIADGNVTNVDLAAGSVDSAKIIDGSVVAADLAANSVDSSKIADLSVSTADLASGAVTTGKISTAGASANYVLQYDGTKVGWGYAPGSEIRYTALYANSVNLGLVPASNTWTKVANLGSVSKLDATSRLEITFNGRIYVTSFGASATGANFEVRLDDAATTNGRARANVRKAEAGGAGVPVSITGIFTGYGAGTHTIDLWIYSWWDTASNVGIDSGNYGDGHIVVREIK